MSDELVKGINTHPELLGQGHCHALSLTVGLTKFTSCPGQAWLQRTASLPCHYLLLNNTSQEIWSKHPTNARLPGEEGEKSLKVRRHPALFPKQYKEATETWIKMKSSIQKFLRSDIIQSQVLISSMILKLWRLSESSGGLVKIQTDRPWKLPEFLIQKV